MEARQLVPTNSNDGRTSRARLCQAVNLPANGVLVMPGGEVITLSGPAAFKPACTPNTQPAIIAGAGGTGTGVDDATEVGSPQVADLRDPFYASTFPQCYALAATTVIAYTLVIMLVITPRSFLDGGVVVLGRRGFTSGGSGSGTIGGRPWLQKVAALTVAISLTIATTDTFRVAEEQYAAGTQNADELQERVLGGTELKIIRIISDTFLWLAQAQTLIRLFPRQREKVIIKWTAFALITFDLIFDSLNSFQYTGPGNTRPGSFKDAIPALSYLFQLALGVLYAAWVIYYSLMKKKYAYYHPQMKNICLVAALSLFAILVPVVFFILDISKPEFTGWGDYVRWVGAAAASVIVWEWVERIEALEREEKRDGILGREVFDGDEMLETLSDSNWTRRNKTEKPPGGSHDSDDGGEGGTRPKGAGAYGHTHVLDGAPATSGRSNIWPSMSSIANRYRSRHTNRVANATSDPEPSRQATNHNRPAARFLQPPLWPSRPPPAVTPISRTDTASADSTVYAIRYHPLTETTTRTTAHPTPPPIQLSPDRQQLEVSTTEERASDISAGAPTARPSSSSQLHPLRSSLPQQASQSPRPETRSDIRANLVTNHRVVDESPLESPRDVQGPISTTSTASPGVGSSSSAKRWRVLAQSVSSRGTVPSDSATSTTSVAHDNRSRSRPQVHRGTQGSRWDLRSRMEDFAATQAERIRERIRPTPDTESLPVRVIPAPPRRGAALAQLLEEEEEFQQTRTRVSSSRDMICNAHHPLASPTSPDGPWRSNSIDSTESISREGAAHALGHGTPPLAITTTSRGVSSKASPQEMSPKVP